jgi:hypothetical protein
LNIPGQRRNNHMNDHPTGHHHQRVSQIQIFIGCAAAANLQ